MRSVDLACFDNLPQTVKVFAYPSFTNAVLSTRLHFLIGMSSVALSRGHRVKRLAPRQVLAIGRCDIS